jgi:hypothetical protein
VAALHCTAHTHTHTHHRLPCAATRWRGAATASLVHGAAVRQSLAPFYPCLEGLLWPPPRCHARHALAACVELTHAPALSLFSPSSFAAACLWDAWGVGGRFLCLPASPHPSPQTTTCCPQCAQLLPVTPFSVTSLHFPLLPPPNLPPLVTPLIDPSDSLPTPSCGAHMHTRAPAPSLGGPHATL